jgi:hypothetical protein
LKPARGFKEKPEGLGIMSFGNCKKGSQVDRGTLEELDSGYFSPFTEYS